MNIDFYQVCKLRGNESAVPGEYTGGLVILPVDVEVRWRCGGSRRVDWVGGPLFAAACVNAVGQEAHEDRGRGLGQGEGQVVLHLELVVLGDGILRDADDLGVDMVGVLMEKFGVALIVGERALTN